MYGLVLTILRSLVTKMKGIEAWNQICEAAEISEAKDGFMDHHYYNEEILYQIGGAASNILGLPLSDILEAFGKHFFETIKVSGHSNMVRTLGHNFYGFLMNLDTLHDHLAITYTQMQAPSFRCEKTECGLRLYYYSKRKGLESIVIGILKAVASDFFSLDIEVTAEPADVIMKKLPYSTVFTIEVQESSKDENYLDRLHGTKPIEEEIEILPAVDSETFDGEYPFFLKDFTSRDELDRGWEEGERVREGGKREEAPGAREETSEVRTSEAKEEPSKEGGGGKRKEVKIREVIQEVDEETEEEGVYKEAKAPLFERSRQESLDQIIQSNPQLLDRPRAHSTYRISSRMGSRRGSCVVIHASDWPITPTVFQMCFPFHIIFDRQMVIRHMGVSLLRLFPRAISSESKLSDLFEFTRPEMEITYTNICNYIHNVFIMKTKQLLGTTNKMALQFRGQMVPTASTHDGCPILFVSSPRIKSVEDMELQGLYLSDIPIHDVTRDLILLSRHFHAEIRIAKQLEETKRDLEIEKAHVQEEKNRADQLLHAMLPKSVAVSLKEGDKARATEFQMVTILFSDIKGFTTICSNCEPMDVVGMLNTLYTRFDNLIERHNVYKVETIGDAYMVAAGLLETAKRQAEAIVNMSFDMREEAGKVTQPCSTDTLQIRIGIHSGPVVAGVVGKKMPRYCLFGDTVNTASRMESHGEPGRIHISEVTYRLLVDCKYGYASRGKIVIKGLGPRETFFIEPSPASAEKLQTSLAMQTNTSSSSLVVPNISSRIRNESFIKYSHPVTVTPAFPTVPNIATATVSEEMFTPVSSEIDVRPGTTLEKMKRPKLVLNGKPSTRPRPEAADNEDAGASMGDRESSGSSEGGLELIPLGEGETQQQEPTTTTTTKATTLAANPVGVGNSIGPSSASHVHTPHCNSPSSFLSACDKEGEEEAKVRRRSEIFISNNNSPNHEPHLSGEQDSRLGPGSQPLPSSSPQTIPSATQSLSNGTRAAVVVNSNDDMKSAHASPEHEVPVSSGWRSRTKRCVIS